MRWACTNGADCSAIQEYQTCFFPNTTKEHASYAFNSYYQNLKHNGASCYFTAATILTELDPSHDSCKFEYLP
ncbi:glucan endo-1 3-beta-glucosidase 4 [Phtheirospermum japonicum]|uniref:Glucan endo-1 3-beta-glucosidase 4 n=1 Tax=Phtheirospermum japonicum TaxID=374723 RepID=A0A830BB88_9LAMI|nr:glucan endo-1 3-beta-glucosidase 4 [Phtheirospermum japonicum]